MLTILLLFCSNTFMTIAWYGHLRFRDRPTSAGYPRELADCICGVLLSSTGRPHRLRRTYRLSTEDNSGDYHADSVCRFRLLLLEGSTALELHTLFRVGPIRDTDK